MGRPLNKKYFGNRNYGVSSPTDDMIGGEGVASVTNGSVGSIQINNTYKTFPALNVAAPTMANGTTAILAVTWEIDTITLSSAGTGYANNLSAQVIDNLIGSIYTSATVQPIITVNSNGTGNLTAIAVGANRGSWTTIDGTGITTWGIKIGAVTSGQATVTFRVKSIAVTNEGSGYAAAPQLSWSQTNGGTMPSAQTPTLTTDSGWVGSSTNLENAILAWAYTGGSLVAIDLQKQISNKRYKFNKTGEVSRTGTEIGRIRYDGIADGSKNYTADQGVEINMVAKDSDNGTYLVRKLTNHTCTLYPLGINNATIGITNNTAGTQFAAGQQVPWGFGSAISGYSVQILNA